MLLLILSAVVVVVVFIIFLQLYTITGPRTRRMMAQIPGYSEMESWVIDIKMAITPIEGLFTLLQETFKDYPKISRIWYLGIPQVYIDSPDYVEELLKSVRHLNKGHEYVLFEPWLRRGLLTSTGSEWRKARKMLTPAFHFRILDNALPIFNHNIQLLVNIFKENCSNGEVIKLEDFIPLCTLDIICEAAMGVKLEALSNKSSSIKYVQAVRRMSELLLRRYQRPIWMLDWIYALTADGREQKKLLTFLHGFTEKVIEENRQKRELARTNGETDLKPTAFVDFLLENAEENPENFSNLEIRQEIDTFMLEGHETSASAISWTLLLLGHDPQIQQRVYNELIEIFGESDRETKRDDLSRMSYLEAVIKESLRLYPPVAHMSRRIETTLQLGEYTIPARTNVVVAPYLLHRNGSFYPDPEKFDPDRFYTSENSKRHPFLFIPFSGGPRNCIGQKFAMMELKLSISNIIRHFRLESVTKREGLKILPGPFLRSMDGIYVKLYLRKIIRLA